LAIIPIAVERQSGPNGRFGATGSRIGRQRRARSGKISVEHADAPASSSQFARDSSRQTSAAETPRSVQ
jgi:hypothetical protein